MDHTCLFCNSTSQIHDSSSFDGKVVKCPRCGSYKVTGNALETLEQYNFNTIQLSNISGYLSENSNYKITIYNIDDLAAISTPSFHQKADKLLLAIENATSYAGYSVKHFDSFISKSWCQNNDEYKEIYKYLKETNRVKVTPQYETHSFIILPDGWLHLEKIKTATIHSNQCFVAMWFSEEMQNVYNQAIAPGIRAAGYDPLKIDDLEHNSKIDDKIITEIRRSKCILADFTGHRGGVYYEAGFAKGLGIEVFWSCNQGDLENLHFDIQQYNCISWQDDKLEDFQQKIALRIESVLGAGKNKN